MADNFQTREERRRSMQQQKKAGSSNRKKKPKGLFKKIMLSLLAFIVICIIGGAATFAYYVSSAPKLDESLLKDPVSSKIYTQDKKLIGEVGKEKRDYVTYDQIPDTVVNAVLATEDSRFFKHHGVDPLRLGSAVVANVTNGFGSQGASTITQQLVKRSFLTDEKKLKRKAQELWLSLKVEQKYSKEEIFEMYINKIFYGSRANGVATAAKTYFGKDLKDLTLPEAATLAGLPQSPSRYNPFEHPERAEKRRNVVLQLMNRHGYISESEMKEAQNVPIESTLLPEKDRATNDDTEYDSFIDQVIEEVQTKTDYNPFTDGLEIYTTMDPDAQKYVYKMLNTDEVINYPNDKLQAGITLLDTKTGEIKAIGGGRKQTVKRGFNYATDLRRQPGSTIKPILDYGPAIEYKHWSTYEQIVDEPYKYTDGTPINNYNNRHQGKMSARDALAKSLNIPALKAMQAVGTDKSREFGEKLGLDFGEHFYESYSIGGAANMSPLLLAGAYSAFGNEGIYNEPHAVTKIVLADKKTTIDMKPEPKVAMKDYTAYMITDMLKSVMTSGTGTMANVPGLHIAGKTGTTNYTEEDRQKFGIYEKDAVPDSWFAGYTTNYTAAIWTGYEKRKDYLGTQSQTIAKKMFKALISEVSKDKHTKDFKKPNSVEEYAIAKGSDPAEKAGPNTPDNMKVYELFVKGYGPTKTSTAYNKTAKPTGLNVEYDDEAKALKLSWNYKDNEDEEKPTFEVSQSVDGGAQQVITTTGDKELTISNPIEGSTYKLYVKAIVGGSKSDPASVTIKIPGGEEEEPGDDEENENPDEDAENNEDQETTTPDNGNNQGNGTNGNGQDNGSNNGGSNANPNPGNNNENGQGNGTNNGNSNNSGSNNSGNNANNGGNGSNNGANNGGTNGSGSNSGDSNTAPATGGTGGTGGASGSGTTPNSNQQNPGTNSNRNTTNQQNTERSAAVSQQNSGTNSNGNKTNQQNTERSATVIQQIMLFPFGSKLEKLFPWL